MNVTDIINAAMQGSESDIAVSVPDNTPAHTNEIEKLAAALDFIGANLEDSEPTFEEKLAEYAMIEEWLEKEAASKKPEAIAPDELRAKLLATNAPTAPAPADPAPVAKPASSAAAAPAPAAPAPKKRKYTLRELNAMSSDERDALFKERPKLGQSYQALLDNKARVRKVKETAAPGNFNPANLEGKQGPQTRTVRPNYAPTATDVDSSPVSRQNSLVVRQKAEKVKNKMGGSSAPAAKPGFFASLGNLTGISDVKGRSGLNRALRLGATAATAGGLGVGAKMGYDRVTQKNQKKTAALLEKVAEDRINPAKINAGPADAYSGMTLSVPASEHDIVRAKAQKVRNRINAEMQQYVNNTGKGYNLDGHLNVFNQ